MGPWFLVHCYLYSIRNNNWNHVGFYSRICRYCILYRIDLKRPYIYLIDLLYRYILNRPFISILYRLKIMLFPGSRNILVEGVR